MNDEERLRKIRFENVLLKLSNPDINVVTCYNNCHERRSKMILV
jgi:hypothetical protein